jgi:hypothetical protein
MNLTAIKPAGAYSLGYGRLVRFMRPTLFKNFVLRLATIAVAQHSVLFRGLKNFINIRFAVPSVASRK